ncbi:iron-containing alcohol dehydrogenase [Acetobacterium fimetarium]|uniref:Iron-containing alcohol dehydrogenase n=1 Tax=Acetobacterium fimetarium TaxID=52691 RepID=A0ABR6WUI5_9FIRM|nr:iron-containing alcohol dehydrogenase family protein [Acetobacterium fimetarium]MBC3804245.1 iron-containing alcohol dehydrogenase [Acetobacterium fimetarium]
MTYSVNLSNYTVGESSYDEIDHICSPYGRNVVLIVGDHGYGQAKKYLDEALKNSRLAVEKPVHFGGECTFENVERLKNETAVKNADMIFAIGGGRVLDTGKCLGDQLGKPVFSFPTIASNCAACTSVSIMYQPDGSFLKPEFLTDPPKHAFIDIRVLVAAPVKYLWAGLGDTYAKYYEATISSRGEALNHSLTLGVHISRQCADGVIRHGQGALAANEAKIANEDFEQTILTIIVTTALVSILVTLDHSPDYNSGLAHAIYYLLTSVPGFDEEKHLHGEIVGFGVLILLLVDQQRAEFERVYRFNCETKLPHSLAELDLNLATLEPYFETITEMADIRHNPYVITVDLLKAAFAELETINKIKN